MHQYTSARAALSKLCSNAKNVSKKQLEQAWEKQQGKCCLSGIPMKYDKNEWRVSLKKLDDDVALCCLELKDWSREKVNEFIDLVDKKIKIQEEIRELIKPNHKLIKQTIDGVEHQNCTCCNDVFPTKDFYKNCNFCKTCHKERQKAYENTLEGKINRLLSCSKASAKKRELEFEITQEFLIELYHKQGGMCAFSGIPLQMGSSVDKDWTMSLKRIDPLKGYTKDNVCMICYDFNTMDQTAQSDTVESGSCGWSELKVKLFVAYVKFNRGEISAEELDKVIQLQKKTISRVEAKPKPEDKPKVEAKPCEIFLITSPSDFRYIGSSEVLGQSDTKILNFIRDKQLSKPLLREMERYKIEEFTVERLLVCRKEDLDEYKEKFIEEYDTNEFKHTKETKQKIKESLVDKVRRIGHDDKELPKYVKFINWADRKGYAIVSHPNCKLKYFVSKVKSLEDCYERCIRFLETL